MTNRHVRNLALSCALLVSTAMQPAAAQFADEYGLTVCYGEPSFETDDRPYDSTAPLKIVEIMPAFKGDLMAYLAANRRYPDSSLARGEEGCVIVQFIVDTTGRIRDPRVVRSTNFPLLNQEALRVLRTMISTPLWTPGKHNGRNKEVIFTLPITFKID